MESTELLEDGDCDIPCPGDPRLFCGGFRSSLPRRHKRDLGLGRRAAPPDVLLTVYELADDPQSSSEISTGRTSLSGTTGPSPIPAPPGSLPSTIVGTTGDDSPTVVSPPGSRGTDGGLSLSAGLTRTIGAEPVTTVITVFYTIVDPRNPSNLITTEYCTTMEYFQCPSCEDNQVPTVEMIVTEASCHGCGPNQADSVMLTLPAVPAAETRTPLAGSSPTEPDEMGGGVDYPGTEPDRLGQAQPTRLGDAQDGPNREPQHPASGPHEDVPGSPPVGTKGEENFRTGPATGRTPLATDRPVIVVGSAVQRSMGWICPGLASLVTGLVLVV